MKDILQAIQNAGGMPLFVGGCVRDELMGIDSKDIDVEVYNLHAEQLVSILRQFGKVSEVGVSFGVIKLTTDTDDYDFSLPRRENKIGRGHKGFQVIPDHTLTPKEAAARRDFTINSVAKTVDGELVDPYGGAEDIQNGILRHTSHHFAEDALRILRGFQFAARFNMEVHPETAELCRTLVPELRDIAVERIYMEFEKLILKGQKPSMGLKFLVDTGAVGHFPELDAIVGLHQDPEWHPEGSVDIHTGLVMDAAVEIAERENLSKEDRMILVLAALCHDLGKANTTVVEDGRIKSPGHDKTGVPLTESFLQSIGVSPYLIERITPLVAEHMCHIGGNINHRFVRRLTVRLKKASVRLLVLLMEADHSGRHPLPKRCPEAAEAILDVAKELAILDSKPKPIVQGRHLIQHLMMRPGPEFKVLLDAAYEHQLDGGFETLDEGLVFVKNLETLEYLVSQTDDIRRQADNMLREFLGK